VLGGHRHATWTVSHVRGNGHHAAFTATYDRPRRHAVVRFTVTTRRAGVVVRLVLPRKDGLYTTVWPTAAASLRELGRASRAGGGCTVTAAAASCPVRFAWGAGAPAAIKIELR
jgi:hypothetical protein